MRRPVFRGKFVREGASSAASAPQTSSKNGNTSRIHPQLNIKEDVFHINTGGTAGNLSYSSREYLFGILGFFIYEWRKIYVQNPSL